MTTTVKELESYSENGETVTWYAISGTDYGTNVEFDNETWGVWSDGDVVDADNYPTNPGDYIDIAVRNALGLDKVAQ